MSIRVNNDFPKYVETQPRTIYLITNLVTGNFYVGSSVNYKSRWSCHIHLLENNKHFNSHLQRAWSKYGKSNFMFTVLIHIFDKHNLQVVEQQYLDYYFLNFSEKLYNQAKKVVGHTNGIDMKGEKNVKAKLTQIQVNEIRCFDFKNMLKRDGYNYLAKKYGVYSLTISRIIRNKLWVI